MDRNQWQVRNYEEKFPELDADDNFIVWPEHNNNSHWMNNDNNDDPTTKKNHQAANKCHWALGCRFDSDGEASFIEAGLYCSFGDNSQISEMIKVTGIPLDLLVKLMINEAMKIKWLSRFLFLSPFSLLN